MYTNRVRVIVKVRVRVMDWVRFRYLERRAIDGGVRLGLLLHLVCGLDYPFRPRLGEHELRIDLKQDHGSVMSV